MRKKMGISYLAVIIFAPILIVTILKNITPTNTIKTDFDMSGISADLNTSTAISNLPVWMIEDKLY